jgi:hypothetical protein
MVATIFTSHRVHGRLSVTGPNMPSWRQIQYNHQLENDGEHIAYDHRYWTAQICLAGHVQHKGFRVIPSEKYCDCGAETIYQCPSCQSNIKGAFRSPPQSLDRIPMGCRKCGTPYPWTQSAIEKVSQAIKDSDLTTAEKQEATSDLEAILKNTPGAESAARRTHGRLAKMNLVLRAAYIDYVVPLAAETLAKIIKGG